MKANEIQIGDWVYSTFSELPCKVTYIKLHESGYGSVETTNVVGVKDIASLSPIPITTEILEKNGFNKDDNKNNMYYWNWGIINNCVSYDKETGIFRIFHTLGHLVFVHPLSYIHQLQHALRLCGIDKTIEL